jgi:hypothetical protein
MPMQTCRKNNWQQTLKLWNITLWICFTFHLLTYHSCKMRPRRNLTVGTFSVLDSFSLLLQASWKTILLWNPRRPCWQTLRKMICVSITVQGIDEGMCVWRSETRSSLKTVGTKHQYVSLPCVLVRTRTLLNLVLVETRWAIAIRRRITEGDRRL